MTTNSPENFIEETESVFGCNMAAIEPSQRAEHIATTRQLLALVQEIGERPDGYALKLPLSSDTLVQAARFISLERLCCPFFGFELELKPAATFFDLVLAGPEGVKPFILAELELNPLN